jgi:hypothetical protein
MKAPGSLKNACNPVIELIQTLVALRNVAVTVSEADIPGRMRPGLCMCCFYFRLSAPRLMKQGKV